MKHKNKQIINAVKLREILLFLTIQIIIYTIFMYIDIKGEGFYSLSNQLKFSSIVLNFLFAIILYAKDSDKLDRNLLWGALLFTVISDLFLLILDQYCFGVFTFCIVQLLYFIRLFVWRKHINKNTRIWKYIIRNGVFISTILVIILILRVEVNVLVFLSVTYFSGIFLNAVDAIIIACQTKRRRSITFSIGMVLFLLCDINVGFFNLADFISIHTAWFSVIYKFASVAMWMFYLPAQVGIAISGNHCYNNQTNV